MDTRRRPTKTLMTLALLIALAGSGCAGGTGSSNAGPGSSGEAYPDIEAAIDQIVLDHLDDDNVPGATVAVTKGSRLVLSKGYGVADIDAGTQMEPWHRTRIGSVSKVLTTVGALQLTEAGQLDLDAPLYSSSAVPIWGDDPFGKPGVVYLPDGVLEDAGTYLAALADAVATHTPPPDPGGLLDPSTVDEMPGYLTQGGYQANVTEAIDWATDIRIDHVLSHTAGFLRSGSADKGADAFEDEEPEDLTYAQLHESMMMGFNGHPFRFRAGTSRAYSNHGFGLMGEVVAQRSGQAYVDYMQDHVFHPLGLQDVAPRDLDGVVGDLDATSYSHNKAGEPVPPSAKNTEIRDEPSISTSTGGWTATAQDLVRVVCAVDETSNNLRLLGPTMAETMVTVPYPSAKSNQPLGWDRRTATPAVTKGGSTPRGGGARVTKYLPGGLSSDEINVAVNTNKRGSPPIGLLRDIAEVIAAADIPDDYDLFDPAFRCRTPLGLAPLPGDGPVVDPDPAPLDALGSTQGGGSHPDEDPDEEPDEDREEEDEPGSRGGDDEPGADDRNDDARDERTGTRPDGSRDEEPRDRDRDDRDRGGEDRDREDDGDDRDRRDDGDDGGSGRDSGRRDDGSSTGRVRVRIERPDAGQVFIPRSGQRTVEIVFAGAAVDAAGIPLAATRLRWTATAGDDESLLCRGGDVPAPQGGVGADLEPLHDEPSCDEFTLRLPLMSRAETSYLVALEAWDNEQVIGHDERTIVVRWP